MKAQWQWIITGIVLLTVGIFLLVSPSLVVKTAVIIFGIYTMLESIYALALTWSVRKVGGIFTVNSIRTLASLGIGILVLYFAFTTDGSRIAAWVVYLIAAWLMLSSILELLEVWILKRRGYESFGVITNSLVSLVISVLMFIFPGVVNTTFFTVVGVIMLVMSAFLIIWGIKMLSFERRVFEKSRESETDWEEL